ncbi:SpoVT/AbrB family regulatory protein [Paenibacillus sp. J22TS3]|nr:SpoVT/AbrB family regulatory protein [Paenibacillus sp. J22TS3]
MHGLFIFFGRGVLVMKPAGVVRKVDQLGRIVLPKSLRKRYQMNEGDPVEILVQGDHIILERYRPKCVFCGNMEDVSEFKERSICGQCLVEMNHLPRHA